MLCDDLLNAPAVSDTAKVMCLGSFKDDLRQATKFRLSPTFTSAAGSLVPRPDQLLKAMPLCKLPYPRTWIEFTQADRLKWFPVRPMAEDESLVKRIGLLLETQSRGWIAQLAWEYAPKDTLPGGYKVSPIAMRFSQEKQPPTTNAVVPKQASDDPLWDYITPEIGSLAPKETVSLLKGTLGNMIVDQASRDWGGEIYFALATLALLNTRNMTHTIETDKIKHNEKRAKQGQSELQSFKTLHIHPKLTAAHTQVGSGEGSLRFHFVRGHFKVRQTGLFWWNDHSRGDPTKGTVQKDYQLEGPTQHE